jgi:uncharacterized LabA/DUF88 family protein
VAALRTYVYIDGFNLYYGQLKHSPHKWLDVGALCRAYLKPGAYTITKIKYFTARVKPRPGDPEQNIRQQAYLRALKTIPGLEIVYGHFLSHKVSMPLADGSGFIDVTKTEEKKSDVNLAVHMLQDGYRNRYDAAVLVSNDSDLAEALRIVRTDLRKKVGILNPQKTPSRELGRHADFQKQIRPGAIAASQFPPKLKDRHGTVTKPARWNKSGSASRRPLLLVRRDKNKWNRLSQRRAPRAAPGKRPGVPPRAKPTGPGRRPVPRPRRKPIRKD